jgi:hypothetical protein
MPFSMTFTSTCTGPVISIVGLAVSRLDVQDDP